jgi:chromatin remodeling complex protein RSC6
MNKTTGAQVARTEVTRFLINYIKEKGLQNEDDKREIVPDTTLRSLLGLNEGQHVSYFELQRHMNRHFPKAEK